MNLVYRLMASLCSINLAGCACVAKTALEAPQAATGVRILRERIGIGERLEVILTFFSTT